MNKLISMVMGAVLLLAGCGGATLNLETNEDRLAAAEISFQETVKLAAKVHPRVPTSTQKDLREAVQCLYDFLVASRVALRLQDDVDFTTNIKALQSGIAVLRPILVRLEENEDGGSFEFNCAT